MENEIWKDIPEYENCYQVSNLGRFKGLSRRVRQGDHYINLKERIMKPHPNPEGYLLITLYKNSKRKIFSVSRVVASTFLLPKEDYQIEVDHINSIKTDNRLENLRWVSPMENSGLRNLNKNFSSKYIGVYYRKNRGKWQASISKGNKKTTIGSFLTEEEAYQARIKYELDNNIMNKFR